jgi:pyruvate formate lyase activating enzyme
MIKGFRGTSLVDYPGKIASVIYTYGCNFRCPYCYNIELVLPDFYRDLPEIPEEDVLENLKKRKGFIQGVVITGGEPTLWERKLRSLIERIHFEIGLPIKLDTNGSTPHLIKKLLEEELLDYIALDFKSSPKKYPLLGGDFQKVKETLAILKDFSEKVEIRITLYPPLVTSEDLEEMLPYLSEFKNIALQKYLPEKNLSGKSVSPYSEEICESFYIFIKKHLPQANLLRRF